MRRLIISKTKPWATLFNSTIIKTEELYQLGTLNLITQISKITNPFWIDVLKSYVIFNNRNKPNSISDILSQPIWLNPHISNTILFIKNWYQNGLIYISDFFDINGNLLDLPKIREIYGVNNIDFITMFRIKLGIKSLIKSTSPHNNNASNIITRPYIPFNVKHIIKDRKGIKTIYKILTSINNEVSTYPRWNFDLEEIINVESWQKIYITCFRPFRDNYLIWLQYRVLTRTLGVRDLLYKMRLSPTNICAFCNNNIETILHLFCLCEIVSDFWKDVFIWINRKLGTRIIIDNKLIIFGYLKIDKFYYILNTILLLAKSLIFSCSRKLIPPNILYFHHKLHLYLEDLRSVAIKNGNLQTFTVNFGLLFSNP